MRFTFRDPRPGGDNKDRRYRASLLKGMMTKTERARRATAKQLDKELDDFFKRAKCKKI